MSLFYGSVLDLELFVRLQLHVMRMREARQQVPGILTGMLK
jgi:hypothetical protein